MEHVYIYICIYLLYHYIWYANRLLLYNIYNIYLFYWTCGSCEKHPDSDKLLVEQIDIGEEAPRQICSGIGKRLGRHSRMMHIARSSTKS